MRTLLIFPPMWNPTAPALSIPWLGAFLKSHGHVVSMRDLNVEFYRLICTPDFLKQSLARVQTLAQEWERTGAFRSARQQDYMRLKGLMEAGEYLITQITPALKILTTPLCYEVEPYEIVRSIGQINAALNLATAPYPGTHLTLRYMTMPFSPMSSQALLQGIANDENNFLREVLQTHFLDSLLAAAPDVIGISVIGHWQVIAALVLADLIKKACPHIHIIIGGQIFTRLSTSLCKNPGFFAFCDYFIVREGEQALLSLIETLDAGGDLSSVPNLIYQSNGQVHCNTLQPGLKLNELPRPDFSDYDLKQYFAPEPVIPMYFSRGCHWGQCAFCDHRFGWENYLDFRNLELVIEDISFYVQNLKARYFNFLDECLPAQDLLNLARQLLANKLDIVWGLVERLEPEFTAQACELLYQAGCRILVWGAESFCQRVLDCMHKGITVETSRQVLTNSSKAGIWNGIFTLQGFPTETQAECEQTFAFIRQHIDIIDSIYFNTFSLAKFSHCQSEPAKFGITIQQSPSEDMVLKYRYTVQSGLSDAQARQIAASYTRQLPAILPNYLFWSAMEWDQMIPYLARKGKAFVKSIQLPPGIQELPPDQSILKSQVKLAPDVFIISLPFDLRAGGVEDQGSTHILYNIVTGQKMFISPLLKKLLQPSQPRSLQDLLSSDIEPQRIPELAAQADSFLKHLYHTGLIQIEA